VHRQVNGVWPWSGMRRRAWLWCGSVRSGWLGGRPGWSPVSCAGSRLQWPFGRRGDRRRVRPGRCLACPRDVL